MPVLLAPDRWAGWLGETEATERRAQGACSGLIPDSAHGFWPVDRRVGNVKNDSPDLFAPTLSNYPDAA